MRELIHSACAALRAAAVRASLLALRKRARRIALPSVIVDAIDNALDVVLAYAALVVTARQKARAGFDHQIPERIELCRSEWMCEVSPAQRG